MNCLRSARLTRGVRQNALRRLVNPAVASNGSEPRPAGAPELPEARETRDTEAVSQEDSAQSVATSKTQL